MFELEEIASGFHDSFFCKYADTSITHSPIYDIYISDSIQDMLDIDIPQEVANLVGGHSSDFAMNYDDGDTFTPPDTEVFTGGPSYTPPSDFLCDLGACVNPNSVMPNINNTSALLLNSPKIDLNTINFAAHSPPLSPKLEKVRTNINFTNITNTSTPTTTTTVSSVNPISNHHHQLQRPRQTSSPIIITSTISKSKALKNAAALGGDMLVKVPGSIATADKRISQQISTTVIKADSDLSDKSQSTTTNKGVLHSIAPGIGGLTFANTIDYNKLKQNSSIVVANHHHQKSSSSIIVNGGHIKESSSTSSSSSGSSSPLHNMSTLHSGGVGQHKLISSRNFKVSTPTSSPSSHQHTTTSTSSSSSAVGSSLASSSTTKSSIKNTKAQPSSPVEPEYPKPAYSYSCLIAMALKNSRSGSLPVSEIYSFMCEHFPYFNTAPNGWKNSVRHNLSLSRSFEKIEKPPTNGGQRKGCLWAMNPEKITKMDEEVLKWSRKDPMAIKNAMVYPEHLEALERGEMKHGSSGDEEDDVEVEGISEEEEISDLEQEIDDNIVIETPESFNDDDVDLEAAVNNITNSLKRDRDFDDEVQVYYNAIDDEDKGQADYLEDEFQHHQPHHHQHHHHHHQYTKRQKLNVNYSIGPIIEHTNFQQINRKKFQVVNRISSI